MSGTLVHAVALVVGSRGVLIRGEAGAGKSSLAAAIVRLAMAGGQFARIVADDRVDLALHHGRVVARPVPPLAGLVEVRGLGIARVPAEPAAVIGFVVDLVSGPRLPEESERFATLAGARLPRLAVPPPGNADAVLWAMCGGFDAVVTVPST